MLFIATLLARPFQPRNGTAKAGIFYLLFTGLLFACSGNAAGAYPIPIEDKTVRLGSGIYTANCQSCHGNGTTPPPCLRHLLTRLPVTPGITRTNS